MDSSMDNSLQSVAIESLQDSGLDLTLFNTNFHKRVVLTPHFIFDYNQAVRFILDVSTQISYIIENRGYAPYSLLHEHISLINDTFVITNFDTFVPIKNNKLLIKTLFKKTKYMAPELLTATTIPFSVDLNVVDYNIVKLCLQSLDIDNNIERLIPTKLYFLFKRVLLDKMAILYV
jgi:hypothetical protein